MWRLMLLSFIFAPVYLIAADSLAVHIYPDSVIVYHLQTYRHCAPMYEVKVTVDSNHIFIVETDTTSNFAACMCYFDIATTLKDLQPGNYSAHVINKEGEYILFSGTIPFSVPNPIEPSATPVTHSTVISDCYDIAGLQAHEDVMIPHTFMRSYPNPFNPVLTIDIEITETSNILLEIFDLSGRWITTVASGKANAGTHRQFWNGSQMPSGVYFVRLQTEKEQLIQKVILLK